VYEWSLGKKNLRFNTYNFFKSSPKKLSKKLKKLIKKLIPYNKFDHDDEFTIFLMKKVDKFSYIWCIATMEIILLFVRLLTSQDCDWLWVWTLKVITLENLLENWQLEWCVRDCNFWEKFSVWKLNNLAKNCNRKPIK
jgi:hypothetical protein